MSLLDACAYSLLVVASSCSARMLLVSYFNARARALREASGLGNLLGGFLSSPSGGGGVEVKPTLPTPADLPPPLSERK